MATAGWERRIVLITRDVYCVLSLLPVLLTVFAWIGPLDNYMQTAVGFMLSAVASGFIFSVGLLVLFLLWLGKVEMGLMRLAIPLAAAPALLVGGYLMFV